MNILSKNDVKSKFIALNYVIDYIDPLKFLEENPLIIQEIMNSTINTVAIGKYALNFMETFLTYSKDKLTEKCIIL